MIPQEEDIEDRLLSVLHEVSRFYSQYRAGQMVKDFFCGIPD
jgi:hypothetical protein